ncbi:MAG TPA: DUF190 domain-containing protein [Gemmatimonadales bacterium]|nr:DUF190 domain-containing protein [Gemmatimonadales bacterium]
MPHRFQGDRTLLRVFFGESDTYQGRPLHQVLLDRFRERGVAGATVLRGAQGFGARSTLHTISLGRLSLDLPLVLEVVETEEAIQTLLPALDDLLAGGLVTLERVRVITYRPGLEGLNPDA